MTPNEEEWADAMRAALRGDGAAYQHLLVEVAAWLRAALRRRLARSGLAIEEAEDIVQDILIGVHTKRHTWDTTRPIVPWLHGIARYKLADAARRLRRDAGRRVDVPDEWLDEVAAPATDAEWLPVERERAIAGLPHGQMQVVQALAVEGISVKAAATRLGMSDGSVRMLFHRGLKRISERVRRSET